MSDKKIVHIISHTHWDREWYLPYEKHHVLLIKLMDTLLKTLDKDSEYKSFHLDGQTIILEDYLQVRPEMKEKLEKYIREGRIHIGPWYILQDEFLTSSEANIRNLLIGRKDASQYGEEAKVGYFPDSFGNMGQAPQILKQAGIETAVFGRGVKPTGFNNTVAEVENYESPYSEMIWKGPDESSVLGILFANWYSNGNEVPVEKEEAAMYWQKAIKEAVKYASTPQLLMMNGCDHQPVQTNLSQAIQTARQLFPEVEFIHSNFNDYIKSVQETLPEDLKEIHGELRSQRTDGWGTLVNTASSRIYLKQMNHQCQTLLEKVAEPLASYAHLLGTDYPYHLFNYAWKTLMQNHPHDSICGCSVDEVHREMKTRFEKSKHITEMIVDHSLQSITEKIDTSRFSRWGRSARPFTVFNSTGWDRSGVVSVQIDLERHYYSEGVSKQQLKELNLEEKVLVDDKGRELDCGVEDLGIVFGYDLPEDKFRQPYMARRICITFEAEKVPALGFQTFAWVDPIEMNVSESSSSLIINDCEMENDYLKLKIENNGSLTVTEKGGGHTFENLCIYEDSGDIGNEYMFRQPDGEKALTTKDVQAKVRLIEDQPFRGTFEITHEWQIPGKANELLDQEQKEYVWFTERKAKRVEKTVPLTIRTLVSLEKNGKGLEVQTSFNNEAKDHRVRALFPTDIEADTHVADSIFEAAERDNVPAPEWDNPSNCQHQQAFVSVNNEKVGLTVTNHGLNEYEILQDGRSTIALTLLRSVGELGDWGVFPTPEAQCLGEHTVRFKIIPCLYHEENSDSYIEAYQYQVPWSVQQIGVHEGDLPAIDSPIEWEGSNLAFSSMKVAEDTGDLMLRWFNLSKEDQQLILKPKTSFERIYMSNVMEEEVDDVHLDKTYIPVRKCEIVTLGLSNPDKKI
ncbi:alpha-mannosidase [Halobacillus shinanisalinarum]|uniref:Alpha-mannosidase n=1 Tax=Halobacillus shinanisalinarum TaxID=2932258 RepID=A0ABY4GVZ8_9BACI|nr:alpha-mannosidase [Halobacillus shinanisalinarum]UOQ91895.1 alpha-mannosidase [Halobacillus shinanisalinarum]